MIKVIIVKERPEELIAYMKAERLQDFLDTLYDKVFRPLIKYSSNDEVQLIAEKLWEKVLDETEFIELRSFHD